jgi:hypothetical protein
MRKKTENVYELIGCVWKYTPGDHYNTLGDEDSDDDSDIVIAWYHDLG